jgi:Cyclic nucleotide-binding domain
VLQILATLPVDGVAIGLAQQLGAMSPAVLIEILESKEWRSSQTLHPEILQGLTQLQGQSTACSLEYSAEDISGALESLLQDQNPLLQAACLFVMAQLDLKRGQTIAQDSIGDSILLKETVQKLQSASECPSLIAFPMLEKVVHLFNSDFFHRMHGETLVALADRAEVRTYSPQQLITEAGDTCRELLLLIEGDANIHFQTPEGVRMEQLHPGQTLDELEVLAHSDSKNTIVADSEPTRILAVPVDTFDDFLDVDRDFARRVLELESQQLQRFMRSLQT